MFFVDDNSGREAKVYVGTEVSTHALLTPAWLCANELAVSASKEVTTVRILLYVQGNTVRVFC